jgi:hypothetical protein
MKLLLSSLFLVSGVIGLLTSLALGYRATPSGYELDLIGSALSVLQIALGLGLMKEWRWAHWLALGPCLLMLVVGVVFPIFVIPFGKSLLQLSYATGILSWDLKGTMVGVAAIQGAVIVFCIFGAVVGYLGLKYLRANASEEVSLFSGRLTLAGRKSIVASAAVWISLVYVAGISIDIERQYVPGFLQTDTMRAQEQKAQERRQAGLTERIAFSADGSRLVGAPTGTSPQEYFLLDLDSGSLSRTAWKGIYLTRQTFLAPILAPDGLSILTQGYWMSLLSGDAIRRPSGEHLGFYAPSRILLYDRNDRTLKLVDLAQGLVVYAVDVASVQRGEPAEPVARGWGTFSQAWSPDRKHYAWLERDGTLSVLSLDDGSVRRTRCGECIYGSFMHFSLNGETLVVPDRVSRSDDSKSTGLMFDIRQLQERTFQYGARLIDASYSEQFIITWYKTRHTLIYRELGTEGERAWGLSFPADTESAFIRGGSLFATTVSDDSGEVRIFSGTFRGPQEAPDISLLEITGGTHGSRYQGISPDGRLVAYAAGQRIDLIDVQSVIRGEPASWSIDLTVDDRWARTPHRDASGVIRVAWSENVRN